VTYRKWGRVVRWENGTLVRVEEAGGAREENGIFLAGPIAHDVILSREDGEGSRTRVRTIADEILRCAQDDVGIERVLVAEGVAVHECDGVRWQEETRRVHVALVRRPWRVLVDDADVAPVASALARCEGERDFEHVIVPPHIDVDANCEKEQLPGGLDGYGRPIERRRVDGEPPNFYRPSYRVRPVRKWLNVKPIPFGVMHDAPRVLALAGGGKALVDDGGRVFITPLRVERVTAAAESGEMLL
jgi:hypothetical protein